MTDVAAFEGQSFGPRPLRICLEKVNEFIGATGTASEDWVEAAPPGFVAGALFVVAPDLLSQLEGFSVIHGEQTFVWATALTVERDLMVSAYVAKVRERAGTHFVTFEMTVRDDADIVASGTSLFLVTKSSPVREAEGPTGPALDVNHRGNPGPGQLSASRSDLVKYAAATRDWNPIHWDHDTAVSAGLQSVVVHGLLQAAWALDFAATGVSGPRPFDSARIRFRNPLYPGSPVTLSSDGTDGRVSVVVAAGDTQYLTAQIVLAGQ
jgi:acyl dehydratase